MCNIFKLLSQREKKINLAARMDYVYQDNIDLFVLNKGQDVICIILHINTCNDFGSYTSNQKLHE